VHLVPGLGSVKLAELTRDRVRAFYQAKLAAGAAPNTVRGVHLVLRLALAEAVACEVLGRNVADGIRLPARRPTKRQVLKVEELRRLMRAVAGTYLEPMVALAALGAMRLGGLMALRWSDVDFETGTLAIERSRAVVSTSGSGGGGGASGVGADGAGGEAPRSVYLFQTPKTPGSRATIRVLPAVLESLRQHRRCQDEARRRLGWVNEADLVLGVRMDGQMLSDRLHSRWFKRALGRAGIGQEFRFHDLRHTTATYLAYLKVPPKVAMAILRHTNLATTLEVYTHSLGEAEEEALELLGRYVGLFADGPDGRRSGPRGGTDGPPGKDA
jgi:integrase